MARWPLFLRPCDAAHSNTRSLVRRPAGHFVLWPPRSDFIIFRFDFRRVVVGFLPHLWFGIFTRAKHFSRVAAQHSPSRRVTRFARRCDVGKVGPGPLLL